MTDWERQLGDSLKSVGRTYYPSDVAAAQAEFLRRRRRRRFAWAGGSVVAVGAMTAAVALVFALQSEAPVLQREPLEIAAPPEGFDARMVQFKVGDGPIGVGIGGEGDVFVVNSEDRSLIKVDPITAEVEAEIPIGGRSDDVAIGEDGVWVSDPPSGRVRRVDVGTESAGRAIRVGAPLGHIGIEVAAGSVWVAAEDHPFTQLDAASGRVVRRYPEIRPTDVAVGDDGPAVQGVYVLNTVDGELGVVDTETGVFRAFDGGPYSDSVNGDLAVGFGALWVAEGDSGKILRVDPSDGEVTATAKVVPGYAAIAIGPDAVWVISADAGTARYRLTRLGTLTAATTGELTLDVQPTDVAVGGDTVWITNFGDDSITRVGVE